MEHGLKGKWKGGWEGWGVGGGGRFWYRCESPDSSCRICPVGKPEGQSLCSEAWWDRQEMAEAISALHGVCLSLLNSGLCLPASLLGIVPAVSCCAFCLLLLLAAHPQSVLPGCFVERRKSEHAGEIFWSSHSLARRRGKCSTCSAINTLALWKAWWVLWKIGRFSAL